MSLLFTTTIQISIVLGAALAVAALLQRRSAALRHWILTVAIFCALAAPIISMAATWAASASRSPWATEVVEHGVLARLESQATPAFGPGERLVRRSGAWLESLRALLGQPVASAIKTAEAASGPVGRAVMAIWIAGVGVAGVLLLVRLLRLRLLGRRVRRIHDSELTRLAAELAHRFGIRRPIVLVQSSDPAMVVTWGCWRPRVLLPESAAAWSGERLRVVLSHELAHVRRNDWAIQIAAGLLDAAFWFNPLVWLAARALHRDAERACDDAVLSTGIAGPDYATHLLAVARDAAVARDTAGARDAAGWSAATAIAQPSTLEERVRAMLNGHLNRHPTTRFTRAASSAALVLATLALASPGLTGEVSAQNGTGSFAGAVYDQAGGLLPSVTLTVTNEALGRTDNGTTDSSGRFAMRDVPAGVYALTMSRVGFATVRSTIDLRPGDFLQRNIVLPLGSLEESVTVVESTTNDAAAPRARPVREIPLPKVPSPCSGPIGGCIRQPTRVFDVKASYPAELRGSGASSIVTLAGRIGMDGYMVDLREVGAPGHPAFVAAALEAVRQWEFTPTYLNGGPVEVNISITVRFLPR